jgi:hypothetical protein
MTAETLTDNASIVESLTVELLKRSASGAPAHGGQALPYNGLPTLN